MGICERMSRLKWDECAKSEADWNERVSPDADADADTRMGLLHFAAALGFSRLITTLLRWRYAANCLWLFSKIDNLLTLTYFSSSLNSISKASIRTGPPGQWRFHSLVDRLSRLGAASTNRSRSGHVRPLAPRHQCSVQQFVRLQGGKSFGVSVARGQSVAAGRAGPYSAVLDVHPWPRAVRPSAGRIQPRRVAHRRPRRLPSAAGGRAARTRAHRATALCLAQLLASGHRRYACKCLREQATTIDERRLCFRCDTL